MGDYIDYNMMSDEEILKDLAEKVERLRIVKRMKERELTEAAGISRKTVYNFRKGETGLSLKNFVRLLKALGEVDRLKMLFPEKDSYSPLAGSRKELPKRVRDREKGDTNFQWGDEQ